MTDDLDELIPDADVESLRAGVGEAIPRRHRRRVLSGLGVAAGVVVIGAGAAVGIAGLPHASVTAAGSAIEQSAPDADMTASSGDTTNGVGSSTGGSGAVPGPAPVSGTSSQSLDPSLWPTSASANVCMTAPILGDHGLHGFLTCGELPVDGAGSPDAWIEAHPEGSAVSFSVISGIVGAPGYNARDTYTFTVPDLSAFRGTCGAALSNFLQMDLPILSGRSPWSARALAHPDAYPTAGPALDAYIADSCR